MSNSTNTTLGQLQQRNKQHIFAEVIPIASLIVLTNGVVFLLFYKTKSLRTPANYLLLSLAISDLMTGLINIPLFIAQTLNSGDYRIMCASVLLHNVASFSIAYHITVITAEKYLAVVNPFGRNMMSEKTVSKTVSMVWLWSALLGTLPSFWFEKWLLFREPSTLYLYVGYNIFCLVFVFLVPFMFMLYAYCVMFRAIWKSLQRRDSRTSKKSTNEKKCLIILLTMAVTFAICWLPLFTMFLIYSFSNVGWINTASHPAMKHAAQTFTIVRYLSSAIDPLLYTFFKQDFWNAFRVLFLNERQARTPSVTLSMRKLVTQRSPAGSDQNDPTVDGSLIENLATEEMVELHQGTNKTK